MQRPLKWISGDVTSKHPVHIRYHIWIFCRNRKHLDTGRKDPNLYHPNLYHISLLLPPGSYSQQMIECDTSPPLSLQSISPEDQSLSKYPRKCATDISIITTQHRYIKTSRIKQSLLT